jgi:hypothetical protein
MLKLGGLHERHAVKRGIWVPIEARLNNISAFSQYRKENTTLHHYKYQLVNNF